MFTDVKTSNWKIYPVYGIVLIGKNQIRKNCRLLFICDDVQLLHALNVSNLQNYQLNINLLIVHKEKTVDMSAILFIEVVEKQHTIFARFHNSVMI